MSFQARSTDDLIRIATAGGGFLLTASARHTEDLIRIANAARNSGARVVFSGLTARATDDLIRIANAGGGCVTFEG